jgi:hypothetical protein
MKPNHKHVKEAKHIFVIGNGLDLNLDSKLLILISLKMQSLQTTKLLTHTVLAFESHLWLKGMD